MLRKEEYGIMLKRVFVLLLALILALSACQMALADPDQHLSPNGSYIYGSTGDGVKQIQTLLTTLGYYSGPIDGKYQTETMNAVRWFQRSNHLTVDGAVGAKTMAVLTSSGAIAATDATAQNTTANGGLCRGSSGQEVLQVQTLLASLNYYSGPLDGLYGKATEEAVKKFQRNNRLQADGIVGTLTMQKLLTGIPWQEEFNHDLLEIEYPFQQPAAVGQTQLGSYYKGASGSAIAAFQQKLKDLEYYDGEIDGIFSDEMEAAVKLFQSRNGLTADGMIGKKTVAALYDSGAIKKTDLVPPSTVLGSGSHGPYIQYLQTIMRDHYFYTGKVDGVYGADMVAAVKNVQAAAGLLVDGKAGPNTQAVIRELLNNHLKVGDKVLSYPVRTLRRGMRGWDVYMLQQRLIAANYLTGIYSKGEFDLATENAVKLAEKVFKIKEDGIFGNTLRRYLWATNVAQDENEQSKYDDWDEHGNFIGTTLRKGSHGEAVSYLQMKLKAIGFLLDDADGVYGNSTEKAVLQLQKMINKQKQATGDDNFIKEDGIVGPQTWTIIRDLHLSGFKDPYSLDANIQNPTEGSELVEVTPNQPAIGAITRKLRLGSSGEQVKRLQQMLIKIGLLPTGADDGKYGPITRAAVLQFQQNVNLAYGSKVILEDGVVGSQTLYHLQLVLSGQELPGKI